MKKIALKAIVISALFFSGLMFGLLTVMAAGAPTPRSTYHSGDTYTTVYRPTEISPPNGTKEPIITITLLVKNAVIASSNLTLTFDLTLEASTGFYPITLEAVYYKLSWQSNNNTLDIDSHALFMKKTLPFSINITNIPEGTQSITVYAYEIGRAHV